MLSEIPFFGTAKNSISLNRLKPIIESSQMICNDFCFRCKRFTTILFFVANILRRFQLLKCMDFWNHYFTHSPFYIFYILKMLFYLLMIYVNNCSMYFPKYFKTLSTYVFSKTKLYAFGYIVVKNI